MLMPSLFDEFFDDFPRPVRKPVTPGVAIMKTNLQDVSKFPKSNRAFF